MVGFARRMKNSFAGILIGMILIPGSVALHAWNEYRTIHRTKGLAEAESVMQPIADPSVVDDSLNQKLVYCSGHAETQETLEDTEFGVQQNAVRLRRVVEMYQWDRERRSGDGNSSQRYKYSEGWHSGRIDSSDFESRYENPQLMFDDKEYLAREVNVGAYMLSDNLKRDMNAWQPILPDATFAQQNAASGGSFIVAHDMIYWGRQTPNPDSPQIGDIRIAFSYVPSGEVSLAAKLNGSSFAQYKTSNGEGIERLYMGRLTHDEVIAHLKTENTVLAWGLRALGLGMCVSGFSLMLGPVQAMFSWIPFLGGLTGFVLFVAAFLMSVVVSSTTIAIAWFAVRPLMSVGLLILSAAAGIAIRAVRTKKEDQPLVLESIRT
ncbi:MAG: TMEM43 family protein [Planctomycetales bacterium]|nr:TMEM43 family protein [Planctomycetales bacterium]